MPDLQSNLEAYIADLFHELEVRLFTAINSYHMDLRQEVLAAVARQLEHQAMRSLPVKPSSPLVPVSEQVRQIFNFPSVSNPWEETVALQTYGLFPHAVMRSPVEERKEERVVEKEETPDLNALVASIEQLIEAKLSQLPALPQTKEEPPSSPSLPQPEVVEAPPATYSWNDFDPRVYARSYTDMPGFGG